MLDEIMQLQCKVTCRLQKLGWRHWLDRWNNTLSKNHYVLACVAVSHQTSFVKTDHTVKENQIIHFFPFFYIEVKAFFQFVLHNTPLKWRHVSAGYCHQLYELLWLQYQNKKWKVCFLYSIFFKILFWR